ncbi:hypothetical protein P22_2615 [Propionispora sp. 2/2-37]|uniref:Crp/Fnr family transcriptional regulator n=1 Tax=Propionispora sp. 2/2-37 TaxID=1677858 RepID=UPI0006BB5A9F|nr:Crp/Fnr family transcriptional regulator [Propionispora sp. 2/2-37]CUH96525.1 hypothetical protein P22_2615 [Propionispora sp. 2/2-37]
MEKQLLTILSQAPLFSGISLPELDAMLRCLRPAVRNCHKGGYLTREGESLDGLGLLLSGQAAVTKENAAGSRSVMAVLHPGDMFGEMVVFSKVRSWPATVVAQTDCSAAFLPPEKMMSGCTAVCGGHRQMIYNLLRLLSERALQLNRKVEYLTIRGMRPKLCSYLLEQYKHFSKTTFVMPLNRNDLADFLHVSRTAMSRELGRMRDEGLIEFHRSSVKIKDLERLKRM